MASLLVAHQRIPARVDKHSCSGTGFIINGLMKDNASSILASAPAFYAKDFDPESRTTKDFVEFGGGVTISIFGQ